MKDTSMYVSLSLSLSLSLYLSLSLSLSDLVVRVPCVCPETGGQKQCI